MLTNHSQTQAASTEERNATGQTALHRAAHNGDTDECIALVQSGAKLDSLDERGWTPLQTADMANMFRTAMALVAMGGEYGGWTIYYPKGKRVLSLTRLLAAAEFGDESIIGSALSEDKDLATLEKRIKKAITHAKNRGTEGGANGAAGVKFLQNWLESKKLAA